MAYHDLTFCKKIMKSLLLAFSIAIFSIAVFSCDPKKDALLEKQESKFTDGALSKFPEGTSLDAFLKYFDLQEVHFFPHPNQTHGHEQGWYCLPEEDLMISATLSEDDVMLLDETPWILTTAESGRREILTPAPHTTGHTDP